MTISHVYASVNRPVRHSCRPVIYAGVWAITKDVTNIISTFQRLFSKNARMFHFMYAELVYSMVRLKAMCHSRKLTLKKYENDKFINLVIWLLHILGCYADLCYEHDESNYNEEIQFSIPILLSYVCRKLKPIYLRGHHNFIFTSARSVRWAEGVPGHNIIHFFYIP